MRPLSLRQRIALVIHTGVSAEFVVNMQDGDIDYEFMTRNGIRAPLLKAAKITPLQLKARGVHTVSEFRTLEFTTLDLVDGAFCVSCVAAYGADELLAEFLCVPQDAVALAGSDAMHHLGVDLGMLLVVCCGAPDLASEVIVQHPRDCLVGVAPKTLFDTGLRANGLKRLGYSAQLVCEQTRATLCDMKRLGF